MWQQCSNVLILIDNIETTFHIERDAQQGYTYIWNVYKDTCWMSSWLITHFHICLELVEEQTGSASSYTYLQWILTTHYVATLPQVAPHINHQKTWPGYEIKFWKQNTKLKVVHPKYKYVHTYMSERSNPTSWHQPNHWGGRSQEIVSVSHDNSNKCTALHPGLPSLPGTRAQVRGPGSEGNFHNSNLESLWLIENWPSLIAYHIHVHSTKFSRV